MHDNAPSHGSRFTKQFLEDKRISGDIIMEWVIELTQSRTSGQQLRGNFTKAGSCTGVKQTYGKLKVIFVQKFHQMRLVN